MDIYLYQNDKPVGPYTEKQLRALVKSGDITQTQYAWHEGFAEWQPLNAIISFDESEPVFPPPPKKEGQTANPLNILVADDEKSTAKAVCYILGQVGHKVDVVHDGLDALEMLKISPDKYQILITDHRMQNMSGLELVEELKQTKFRGKIIVFTGYITEELEDSYRQLGITYFFNKPLDLKRLPDLVAKIA